MSTPPPGRCPTPTSWPSVFHVLSAKAVVAGDIVYDNVHMMQDLVNGMLELHGDRDNPHTLWISARAEGGRRA
jgi:hypothetical protein